LHSLHDTLAALIRIPSVNAFYAGGTGEASIARFIEQFFRDHHIETVRQSVIPASDSVEERFNVIAKVTGGHSNRRIVMEAHMDTVSVQGMSIPPFEPTVNQGWMYGRGACDTKAGLAAMMHALVDASRNEAVDRPEIWLASVVDEEYSFRGVAKLCENISAQAAIVAEPTENRLVVASKGVLRWQIVARGRSAHSSKCHLGVNAIEHMARIIAALEHDHSNLSASIHPLLGSPSCNVGRIWGGVQVNFVPDECVIEIDRRLLPHESLPDVLQHYESLIHKTGEGISHFDVRQLPPLLVDEAWAADPESAIVRKAQQVLKDMDMRHDLHGVPFGSDASKLERAGVPTILFGPGSIDQAHAAVEYVDLEQVTQAYNVYCSILKTF
jgi:acetylornithine deacetylase